MFFLYIFYDEAVCETRRPTIWPYSSVNWYHKLFFLFFKMFDLRNVVLFDTAVS